MQPIRIFGDPFRSYGAGGGASGLLFLLRDEFTTAAAAPLASPHTAEPGPGALTTVDTGARWLISSGILETNAGSTAVVAAYSAQTRAAGLTFRHKTLQNSAQGGAGTKTISPAFGWSTTIASVALATLTGVYFWTVTGQFNYAEQDGSSTSVYGIDICASDAYYEFAHVLRIAGAFDLVKTAGVWKLVFPHAVSNAATMYAVIAQASTDRHPPKVDYARIAQLGSPWNSDYGIATDRLAGARSVSDAFVHEAGAQWIEFTLTTLPAAGSILINFRRTDDNNCWQLEVTSAGAVRLDEIVSGVDTNRCSSTAINGDRILCVIDGANTRLFRMRAGANTQSSIYASVSTFTTQTSGVISSLGTGGAVSDLIAWPRNVTGNAASELERMTP